MTCRHDRAHAAEIRHNLDRVAELEGQAVRITSGPAGRCFEMAGGRLLTMRNEQPKKPDGFLHLQAIQMLCREDAEDYYGWSLPVIKVD